MDLDKLKKVSQIHNDVKDKIINYLDNRKSTLVDLYDLKKFIGNEIGGTRNTKYGIAFPICLSVDNIAAHYSPNEPNIMFNPFKSIIKIDYGIHLDGNLIDSAFNYTQNDDLGILKKYSEEATSIAINECGIDGDVYEVGKIIEEYINSLELTIDGKLYQLKSFEDLCGHKINLYKVHDNVPFPNIDVRRRGILNTYRMKENDCFAIEPYLTTGKGVKQEMNSILIENNDILNKTESFGDISNNNNYFYNFNLNYMSIKKHIGGKRYKSLSKNILKGIDYIRNKFYNFPFEYNELTPNSIEGFNYMMDNNMIEKHDIVMDINKSFVAQTETNIYVTDNKIVKL